MEHVTEERVEHHGGDVRVGTGSATATPSRVPPRRRESMRIVLLGPPGSGKGTQGRALAERFQVPYIGSGELLRARAATDRERGGQLAAVLDRGDLVGDDAVLAVVRDALIAAVAAGGYVLDGFPRTVGQAEDLEAVAAPDAVVHLALSDAVARRRLAGRAGAGRKDDVAPAIERRLSRYHREIGPLLDFYRRRGVLTTVDADQAPDAVTAMILDALAGARRERPWSSTAEHDVAAMAADAWGWMDEPGDPDVAGQPAEFVDLEPNLPGAGVLPSRRGLLLPMPVEKEHEYATLAGRLPRTGRSGADESRRRRRTTRSRDASDGTQRDARARDARAPSARAHSRDPLGRRTA